MRLDESIKENSTPYANLLSPIQVIEEPFQEIYLTSRLESIQERANSGNILSREKSTWYKPSLGPDLLDDSDIAPETEHDGWNFDSIEEKCSRIFHPSELIQENELKSLKKVISR